MPKKNRKPVEPVSLPAAPAHYHPRDWEDYVHEVNEMRAHEKAKQDLRQFLDPRFVPNYANHSRYLDQLREKFIKDEAVDIANNESMKAFWDDINSGKLVLVGHSDTGDGLLWRIPKYVSRDPSAYDDWLKARLSWCGLNFVSVGVLTASAAKNVPEFCGAKEEQDRSVGPPAKTNYEEMLRNRSIKVVVITAGEELLKKADKDGHKLSVRIHKLIGSPDKPPLETVRRIVPDLFPGQT